MRRSHASNPGGPDTPADRARGVVSARICARAGEWAEPSQPVRVAVGPGPAVAPACVELLGGQVARRAGGDLVERRAGAAIDGVRDAEVGDAERAAAGAQHV